MEEQDETPWQWLASWFWVIVALLIGGRDDD